MKMTVEQLVSFVRSSIQFKQPDKLVAATLAASTLSERLDNATIDELQSEGAGPKTVEALRALKTASQTLAAPAKPTPTPPPPPPIPPPSEEEQHKVIEQARAYAMNYTKSLPDFLCTEVTRRYVDPHGTNFFALEDTLTARLTYFDHKEDYKLFLVDNRAVNDKSMESVGGAVSTGEFGSLMKEIFDPETETDFRWERWATLRGRRTHVYTYRVSQSRSRWHVTYTGREAHQDTVPGYHGEIFVDRDMQAVVRISMEAEISPDFPIQQASDTLDYDLANISGQDYLLPLRAIVRMKEGRYLSKNEVEFRLYRKFDVGSVLKFEPETPDALPDDKTKEQPVK